MKIVGRLQTNRRWRRCKSCAAVFWRVFLVEEAHECFCWECSR